jgi:hypothetical protein
MIHELCFAFPSNLISCPTLVSRYNLFFFSLLLVVCSSTFTFCRPTWPRWTSSPARGTERHRYQPRCRSCGSNLRRGRFAAEAPGDKQREGWISKSATRDEGLIGGTQTYLVVCGQPLSEGLDIVVGSLDEGLASQVIGHVLLGRVDCERESRLRIESGQHGNECRTLLLICRITSTPTSNSQPPTPKPARYRAKPTTHIPDDNSSHYPGGSTVQ